MKAYIGNIDWADEGNVFFFSVENEEVLQTVKDLIKIYEELNLFPKEITMYWGTNEFFMFNVNDLLRFINNAKDISDEELEVFNKFGVYGFDIYERIIRELEERLNPWWGKKVKINKEGLSRIEPLFVKLFGQEEWDEIIEELNNK